MPFKGQILVRTPLFQKAARHGHDTGTGEGWQIFNTTAYQCFARKARQAAKRIVGLDHAARRCDHHGFRIAREGLIELLPCRRKFAFGRLAALSLNAQACPADTQAPGQPGHDRARQHNQANEQYVLHQHAPFQADPHRAFMMTGEPFDAHRLKSPIALELLDQSVKALLQRLVARRDGESIGHQAQAGLAGLDPLDQPAGEQVIAIGARGHRVFGAAVTYCLENGLHIGQQQEPELGAGEEILTGVTHRLAVGFHRDDVTSQVGQRHR